MIFLFTFKKKKCNNGYNHNFRSLIACGSSGSLISLICWGMFMFFTAEMALVGAAESPACKENGTKKLKTLFFLPPNIFPQLILLDAL